MKKGLLRIDVPGYDPERVAGKPYKPATYSQVADASRISIKDQAREYALWLMKNDRHHCYVYPCKKSSLATSNQFRECLLYFHRGHLRGTEVGPDEFLGGVK